MTLLVDTSVWSLALRRDSPPDLPAVAALEVALESGELVVTTGLVLQEILRGLPGYGPETPFSTASTPFRFSFPNAGTMWRRRIFGTGVVGTGSRLGPSTRCWGLSASATD